MLTHVQHLLGQKSLINTKKYTHLIDYSSEKYYSATARTLDEGRQLAEDGWTYFQEFEGIKVLGSLSNVENSRFSSSFTDLNLSIKF